MGAEADHFRHSLHAQTRHDHHWQQRLVECYSQQFLNRALFADLQNVHITLRILHRPLPEKLPSIYLNVGTDYAERILPSITNEVLKAVVVRLSHYLLQVVVDATVFVRFRPSSMRTR
jgi:hypothetical protein